MTQDADKFSVKDLKKVIRNHSHYFIKDDIVSAIVNCNHNLQLQSQFYNCNCNLIILLQEPLLQLVQEDEDKHPQIPVLVKYTNHGGFNREKDSSHKEQLSKCACLYMLVYHLFVLSHVCIVNQCPKELKENLGEYAYSLLAYFMHYCRDSLCKVRSCVKLKNKIAVTISKL